MGAVRELVNGLLGSNLEVRRTSAERIEALEDRELAGVWSEQDLDVSSRASSLVDLVLSSSKAHLQMWSGRVEPETFARDYSKPLIAAVRILGQIGSRGAEASDALRRLLRAAPEVDGFGSSVPETAGLAALRSMGAAADPFTSELLRSEHLPRDEVGLTLAAIARASWSAREKLRGALRDPTAAAFEAALRALALLGPSAQDDLEALLEIWDGGLADADLETQLARTLLAVAPAHPGVRARIEGRRASSLEPETPIHARLRLVPERPEEVEGLLARIAREVDHDRNAAIAELAAACADPAIVVPLLVSVFDDPSYAFCAYEGCVPPVAELLVPYGALAAPVLAKLEAQLSNPELANDVNELGGALELVGAIGPPARRLSAQLEAHGARLLAEDPLALDEVTRALLRARASIADPATDR